MIFVKGGYETLLSSNYYAFTSLNDLTFSKLLSNTGFYLSLSLIGFFIILFIFSRATDHKYSTLLKMRILETQLTLKTNFTKYKSEPIQHRMSEQQLRNPNNLRTSSSYGFDNIHPHKFQTSFHSSTPKKSLFKKVFEQMREISNKSRRKSKICYCCLLCFRFAHYELSQNNQVYQLLFNHSLFFSRSLRLLFLFLGVHLQLALCALFFNFGEEKQNMLSYSSFVSNFWVGVFSVLMTVPLMLLVSLCFKPNQKKISKLLTIKNQRQFEEQMSVVNKSNRCKHFIGWVLFVLISSFCFLYMISFCELTNRETQVKWLTSSLISIAVDLVAFEILPALVVSSLGVLSFGCHAKCFFCFIFLIEGYRAIRSFVGM